MSRLWTRFLVALVGTALAACGDGQPDATTVDDVTSVAQVTAALEAQVQAGPATALVVINESLARSLAPIGLTPPVRGAAFDAVGPGSQRARVLASARTRLGAELAAAGVTMRRGYDNFPVAVVRVDSPAALRALAAHRLVTSVQDERAMKAVDATSLALIGQPTAAAAGHTGAGTAVAVLDTGVEYTRAAFGSCTAPGVPTGCRVPVAMDFAPSDGVMDTGALHGTNVAGIVAAVAPGTQVLALDVFRDDGFAYDNDILAAVDWVVTNRATYNIAAMNLSLGGGSFASNCDYYAADAMAFAAARDAGVVPVVASGNESLTTAIAFPACLSASVSVGAVYKQTYPSSLNWGSCTDGSPVADLVTCFSNSSPQLTLLAPGALITAAGITMGGTSQATPHVAGAMAVLRGAFPSETSNQRVDRLVATGKAVTDGRNGVTKPRIDLAAATTGSAACAFQATTPATVPSAGGSVSISLTTGADCNWTYASDGSWLAPQGATSGKGSATLSLAAGVNGGAARVAAVRVTGDAPELSVSVSQAADLEAPVGSVVINGGDAWTRASVVTLAISGSDPAGVTQMCVTTSTSCSSFELFATTRVFSMGTTSGQRTVSVWLRDARGNTSGALSDTIGYDATAPSNGSASIITVSGTRYLTWSGFADSGSGLAGYRVQAETGSAPTSCTTGSTMFVGTGTSVADLSSTSVSYGYRVCALDAAGNVSSGVAVAPQPFPETQPPTGTLSINTGAAATRSTTVTLAVSAQDASPVTSMCVTEATFCSSWATFAPSRSFTLGSTQGVHTVRVWLRDSWGNVTPSPIVDDIVLDTTAPTGGAVVASISSATVALSWSGFVDAASGVASYRVVYATATTTAPSSCSTGTLAGEGAPTARLVTGLTNGTSYAFRVCAIDAAGNISAGATVSAVPKPESDAPVGSFSINGGAAYSRKAMVTLALAATDASGVAQVCIGESTTCTAWQTWATTRTYSLSTGNGLKTVRVWFKDVWGTVSAPVQQTIYRDSTVPVNGTLSGTVTRDAVSLSWSGFSDAASGIDRYRLVFSLGTTAPSSCLSGTVAFEGNATSFAHAGRAPATSYSYRVCAIDRAGSRSTGATRTLKTTL